MSTTKQSLSVPVIAKYQLLFGMPMENEAGGDFFVNHVIIDNKILKKDDRKMFLYILNNRCLCVINKCSNHSDKSVLVICTD